MVLTEDFLPARVSRNSRNTKPYYEKIGVVPEMRQGSSPEKDEKKAVKYYGCEDNPECDFMSWQKPSDKKCPVCGSYMVEKGNKLVCSQETCGYVEARPKDEKKIKVAVKLANSNKLRSFGKDPLQGSCIMFCRGFFK